MLFNSLEFIALFLPLSAALFFLTVARFGQGAGIALLALASLVFYGYWRPGLLPVLLLSVLFNYAIAAMIARRRRRFWLALGIAGNLAWLGWFKYANFLVDSINRLGGADWQLASIVLPLAISFFTFQQIAYQVDLYRGEAETYDFARYALFVSFFPQLIAGPIVHHREMMPQMRAAGFGRLSRRDLAVGSTIFIVGLAKKVLIADNLAPIADPIFQAAEAGIAVSPLEAWAAALAFTFQLYFDFSGYSDMAIGLARIFGVRLPLNFNAPYKARSIVEFWRRWHMTLSRFLRDYLYFPLGGGRRGPARRYVNLMIVMLLGGLWHGAGWTFVAWGGLHGLYLAINHGWRYVAERAGWRLPGWSAHGLTLLAAVWAWVLFRAESFDAAITIHGAMLGFGADGAALIALPWAAWPALALAAAICLFAPTTQEWLGEQDPAFDAADRGVSASRRPWRAGTAEGIALGGLAAAALFLLGLGHGDEFLYFQF